MSALAKIAAENGLELEAPRIIAPLSHLDLPPGRHREDYNPYKGSVEDLCEAGLVTPPAHLYLCRAVCRKDFATGAKGEIVAPSTGKDNAHDAHWYEVRAVGEGVKDPAAVGDWVAFCSAGADPIDPGADSPMWVKVEPEDVVAVITRESRQRWLQDQAAD